MTVSLETCAVIAHDAGGAEVLSSYVRRQGLRCVYVLQGPALKVFERKLGPIENLPLEEAIRQADWVLCGTSWQSELEFDAIKLAHVKGKRSVAFLDHWCNYRERFERVGVQQLPDEIWVGDLIAEDIARNTLPSVPVRVVENPYFMDVEEEFAGYEEPSHSVSEFRILYLCEAIAESGRTLPSGELIEYRSMSLFFEHLKSLETDGKIITVRIRAHPAEESGKYVAYLEQGMFHVELSENTTLIEDCVWADMIVGMDSMALIVAKIGGKKVYYCNLDGAKPESLPVAGLKSFLNVTHLE